MYYSKSYGVKNTRLSVFGKHSIQYSFWYQRYQLLLCIVVFYFSKLGYFVNRTEIKKSPFGVVIFVQVYKSIYFRKAQVSIYLLLKFFQKVCIIVYFPNIKVYFKIDEFTSKTKFSSDKLKNSVNSEISKVIQLAMEKPIANVCAQIFAESLGRTIKHQQNMDYIGSQFESSFINYRGNKGLCGYYIVFSGRWGGSDRTLKVVYKRGKVGKQEFQKNLDYAFHECVTPYGVCNIKIWFNYVV